MKIKLLSQVEGNSVPTLKPYLHRKLTIVTQTFPPLINFTNYFMFSYLVVPYFIEKVRRKVVDLAVQKPQFIVPFFRFIL